MNIFNLNLGKLMAKNLVVKDNALINASYNLDLVEHRLIILAIIEARATGKGITPNDALTITASSYMNNFGTNRNTSYQALKDASKGLFDRQFSYNETNAKGNIEVVRSRWVSEIRYIEKEASVKLIFSPTVAPLITLLEKNFTSYELEQISELTSKYAIRLYEIITAWRSHGKTPMLMVDDLRARLGILDNEYQKMEVLKRKVIDFAIKQINENTDIIITYDQIKQGRKIIGFTFEFEQKSKKKITKQKDTVQALKMIDMFSGLTDIERQTIQKRIDEHIKRLEQKGEVVGEFHRNNITKKAVFERWGLDVLVEKERKKQLRQAEIAKEKVQKQAEQKKKEQRQQEVNELKKRVSEKFESLSFEQRENILNQVAKKIGTGAAYTQPFKKARDEGVAHTDTRFLKYFAECFNL